MLRKSVAQFDYVFRRQLHGRVTFHCHGAKDYFAFTLQGKSFETFGEFSEKVAFFLSLIFNEDALRVSIEAPHGIKVFVS